MPEKISSTANPRVRRLAELQKKARARRESGLFPVEGTRLCMDAPDGFIEEIYVTEEWLRRAPASDRAKIEKREQDGRQPLFILSGDAMARASGTDAPQGILCLAKMPAWTWEDIVAPAQAAQNQASRAGHPALAGEGRETPAPPPAGQKPLILLLEDIQDPGNLGTMFRTAEAAGATGILMSRGTVDLFNPKTVRATMSAIFRMPFLVCGDLCADMERLRGQGIQIYAAHLEGARAYDALPLAEGAAFLVGNEARGLSARAADAADEKIIIPMAGRIESLNAAMAAGILLFEAARQRRNR